MSITDLVFHLNSNSYSNDMGTLLNLFFLSTEWLIELDLCLESNKKIFPHSKQVRWRYFYFDVFFAFDYEKWLTEAVNHVTM